MVKTFVRCPHWSCSESVDYESCFHQFLLMKADEEIQHGRIVKTTT